MNNNSQQNFMLRTVVDTGFMLTVALKKNYVMRMRSDKIVRDHPYALAMVSYAFPYEDGISD